MPWGRGTDIRVYQGTDAVTLIVTGADRKGRETHITLTYSDADELAQALTTRLIARIPGEPREPCTKRHSHCDGRK